MAQKRRKEQLMKRRERRLTALCIGGGIGAIWIFYKSDAADEPSSVEPRGRSNLIKNMAGAT